MRAFFSLRRRAARNTVTPVTFVLDLVEVGGRFLVDRVTARFMLETGHAQLLELARTRLTP